MRSHSLPPARFALRALVLACAVAMCAATMVGAAEVYGAGVGELEPTPIARIVARPDEWRGREVVVRGTVTGVCKMMGCWMELEQDGARVRIKVKDGVIVFPGDAEGRTAVARGKVELLEMERDQFVEWRRHEAEELGQAFDEASIGSGPYRVVQIAGLGAAIAP